MTGSIAYFILYEWMHLGHHIPSYRPLTRYGSYMKKYHQWHHHANENYWWGVTNPLADYLFKTCPTPDQIKRSPTVKKIQTK